MDLYRWRSTRYGLTRMIEVCTGLTPEISDGQAQSGSAARNVSYAGNGTYNLTAGNPSSTMTTATSMLTTQSSTSTMPTTSTSTSDLAAFSYGLQQTMVLPALPYLQEDLHTTTTWSTWRPPRAMAELSGSASSIRLPSAMRSPALSKSGGL
jgi:hypothetical protein